MKAKKKVWPRKAHYLYIPIYCQDLYFCTDRATFVECLDCLGADVEPLTNATNGRAVTIIHPTRGRIYMAGVFNRSLATLAHEIGHICFWLLRDMGVEIDADNNEAFCYLQGWMFNYLAPRVKK